MNSPTRSYEDHVKKEFEDRKLLPEKVRLSLVRYFWEAGPLAPSKKDSIPQFFREIEVLQEFTDWELKRLSDFFHHREFKAREIIFREGQPGFGFYFIMSGVMDIYIRQMPESKTQETDPIESQDFTLVTSLERKNYFGELALLQDKSYRSASAVAREKTHLIGLFKPDLQEMIETYPRIAAKFVQAISIIIANRLSSVTSDMQSLKQRLKQLEQKKGES